jgi:DNA-binding response OmpR family regulator
MTDPRPASPSPARILVVDDSRTNRNLLVRRLEQHGHHIDTADDGQQALDKMGRQSFDLVLLDVIMPNIDGYQVLAHMKATESLRDIPVIMISAADEIDSVVKGIELGAEDYLPKPFDPILLKARINACLEKKHLRDQEVQYLQQVKRVTAAAAEVEAGAFDPASLADVAERTDALGTLAKMFQRMALEVRAREERLRQQLEALTIKIDETKKSAQVAEITDTDYFQNLQKEAARFRSRGKGAP